ncbi:MULTISPECIES: SusC/RagA family TonB-linked outer membrane protein [unclassified Sphingobacterium]|uniref:SusC/RagA family TonB-linked outer membrane protein n=1 Tax=unclassified Sphingobacterium TaxID=2609468 RepID=UPI0010471BEF|nr:MULTISPECIES: SusC/RagA family TonB-linked outer membrane protein [unclassified Sphingobacterium]MCS3555459.1 iron complex outermembrane receptor protein [Sphingobacterium sp. JUb21]TCR02389.1 iron complex outermembrane receptor protein [Sphingobacterium sp. JUb20]
MNYFQKKSAGLALCTLVSASSLFAQQSITGTVKDASGPVSGVTVTVKGTSRATQTTSNGSFTIQASQGEILRFTTIGYKTTEITVGSTKSINVSLTQDASALDEVVVTAMGIKRDSKALGYAVSNIKSEEITKAGNTNFGSALYGKAPGVKITTAPGGSASAVNVQIRGINSLNYQRQPLYVVDGIIIRNDQQNGASGANNNNFNNDQRIRGNGMLDINPSDIDNISILKGAAASALYGSDAASGVIVITTKKGTKGRGLGVDFNYNGSLERAAFLPKFQNEYGPGYDATINTTNGATAEGWITDPNSPSGRRPYFRSYASFGPKFTGEDVLWWDGQVRPYVARKNNYYDVFDKGYNSTANVGISNQTEKLNYRLSATRMDYKSTSPGSKQNKNTFNLNSSLKLSDKISTDIVANYINTNTHNRTYLLGNVLGSFDGFFSRTEDMAAMKNAYQTSDGYKYSKYGTGRPEDFTYTMRASNLLDYFWNQYKNSYDETENRLLTSATLNWDIVNHLKFRGRIGNDFTSATSTNKQYNENATVYNLPDRSTGGYATTKGAYSILYGDAMLTYSNKINQDFDYTASVGFQSRSENYDDQSSSTDAGLVTENWFSLSNSLVQPLTTNNRKEMLKYAYFGSLNVGYKGYLYLDGTYRSEYSSTLPVQNNNYQYGSVSGSFIFSDAFNMKSDKFSYGKLRASYGIVGNDAAIYEANIAYMQGPLLTVNGAIPALTYKNRYGNLDLRPERKYEMEFGLELKFLKNRLGLDVSYYNNYIENQILGLTSPASTGATSQILNIGKIANNGLELSLNGTPIQNENFTWTSRLNYSFNNSRVKELMAGVNELVFYSADANSLKITAKAGEKLGNIYVYDIAKDDHGNNLISDEGYYVMDKSKYKMVGNIMPKAIGGWTNTFTYKNFMLDFTADYRFGGKMVSENLKYGMASGLYENTLPYRETGVTLPGVNANTGKTNDVNLSGAEYYFNTFNWGDDSWSEKGAVYDNDFIKLRELSIGYRIPDSFTKRIKMNNLRFSLIGRNLFYIYRTLENLDPEAPVGNAWWSQGVDVGSSAATRSFGFSLNANF